MEQFRFRAFLSRNCFSSCLSPDFQELSATSASAQQELQQYRDRLQALQTLMSGQLRETHDRLSNIRADELDALKSSVVASIGEFKNYMLHSFGTLQQALEANATAPIAAVDDEPNRLADASTLAELAEKQMRAELENTERISRALLLCERICRDIEDVRLRTIVKRQLQS